MRSASIFIGGLALGVLLVLGFVISKKYQKVPHSVTYKLVAARIHGNRVDGIENEMNSVLRIDVMSGRTWIYVVNAQGQDSWQPITDDPLLNAERTQR